MKWSPIDVKDKTSVRLQIAMLNIDIGKPGSGGHLQYWICLRLTS